MTRATNNFEEEKKIGGEALEGRRRRRRECCLIKGFENCVTDRRRRIALDGVSCILISFESREVGGGQKGQRGSRWWLLSGVGLCFHLI